MFGFEDFVPTESLGDFFDFDNLSSNNTPINESLVSDNDFEDPLGEPRSTQITLPDIKYLEGVLSAIGKSFEIVDYEIVTLASGAVILYIWYRRKKGITYPKKGDHTY